MTMISHNLTLQQGDIQFDFVDRGGCNVSVAMSIDGATPVFLPATLNLPPGARVCHLVQFSYPNLNPVYQTVISANGCAVAMSNGVAPGNAALEQSTCTLTCV